MNRFAQFWECLLAKRKGTAHQPPLLSRLPAFVGARADLERALKAIEEFPAGERDIQTLTIGISNQGYRLIKQEMQEFIGRVVRIADDDKNSDRVYNVNVHLFPMSVREKRKGTDGE